VFRLAAILFSSSGREPGREPVAIRASNPAPGDGCKGRSGVVRTNDHAYAGKRELTPPVGRENMRPEATGQADKPDINTTQYPLPAHPTPRDQVVAEFSPPRVFVL